MEIPEPSQKSKQVRWIPRALAILVGLVVIAGFLLPLVTRSYKDPMLGECHSLMNLGRSLQTYAGENDGKFPESLEVIDVFHRPFTYFPGFTAADPGDTILVASSHSFSQADGTRLVGDGPHRMVLSLDRRRYILKDADYQVFIKKQQRPGWTTAKVT